MALFKEHTIEQQARNLAMYLPDGKAWYGKFVVESNIRKFLNGLSVEFTRLEQKFNELLAEANIATTSALIGEWEKLFGIPDGSIVVADTVSQRRLNVLFKISVFGAAQATDWERIASVLGYNVTVTPADDGGDIPYSDWRKRFIIVVTFSGTSTTWPMTWPILWGGYNIDVVKTMFEKIKPANCLIVYRGG